MFVMEETIMGCLYKEVQPNQGEKLRLHHYQYKQKEILIL
jgi:hypothetical protein